MLEIQRIRNEKEGIIEGLKKRHFDAEPIIDELLKADESWRQRRLFAHSDTLYAVFESSEGARCIVRR